MDIDFCYFPDCEDHHTHTPPTNPQPTYEQMHRWQDTERRQYANDRNPLPQWVHKQFADFMATCKRNDYKDALVYGMQWAEDVGLAYWSQSKGDWIKR